MIAHNTINTCKLIKQAFARVKKALPINDAQSLELAIAFTFLRRIDCMIGQYAKDCYEFHSKNQEKLSDEQLEKKLCELSGGHPFYNVSGYTFEGLLNSDLSAEVALNSYLQGFSVNIWMILLQMNFKQKVAVLFRQSRFLVELFEFYSELNLSISAFSNKEYINLITILASDGYRNSGLYPTPVGLSKLMCECLFNKEEFDNTPHDDIHDGISIYDPACGTGSLLAYAGEKAKALSNAKEDLFLCGQEISPFASAVAKTLVLLTGGEDSYVADVNTLTEESTFDTYRYIVGDLPLGLSWSPFKERIEKESLKEDGRYSKGLPGTNDSQFLFIEDIVSKMDEIGGRAAFITTSSILNGGSVTSGESRIRRWLFESDLVETVIALPSGVLAPYSNVSVYLWILSMHDIYKEMEGKVRLIDATKLVSSLKQFKFDDNFIDLVVKEYQSLDNTSATQIVSNEDLGFYEVNLREGSKKETIRISLNTNIHEYIEKERKPYAKEEIIIEFSSVEKGYSIDFSKFFKPEEVIVPSLKEETNKILSVMDAIDSLKNDIERIELFYSDKHEFDTWREIPLRAIVDFVHGNISNNEDLEGTPVFLLPYLKGESLSAVEFHDGTKKYKRIKLDDVIFVKSGASVGEVFNPIVEMIPLSLEAIRCMNKSILIPGYLYYLLKGYEKSFKSLATGITVKSINIKSLLDFKCLIPPLEEQRRIVDTLDNVVGKIDEIIKGLSSSDNVFVQYRQTLIENVVRGRVMIK